MQHREKNGNAFDYSSQVVSLSTKYAVCVKWSPDDKYMAVAVHDRTVHLYRRATETSPEVELVKIFRFNTIPESLVFYKAGGSLASSSSSTSSSSSMQLIVALREVCHLVYINCETFAETEVSLNENAWDLHCSFNALHLSTSPDEAQKYLLVSTDKSLLLCLRTGTNERVRTFAGHVCGDYGRPRTAWDPTGAYIYCNSDADFDIKVYEMSSQRTVHSLSGHRGQVRDMAVHPSSRILITGSYDRTVRLWSAEAASTSSPP